MTITDDNVRIVRCPGCGSAVPWTKHSRYRPFCSQRCKLIDLGEWASEHYVTPCDDNEPVNHEDLE